MMRFLTLALLASAALPVAAHAQDDNERPRTGSERREGAVIELAQRGDGGNRARFGGGNRAERPQVDRSQRSERPQFDRGSRADQRTAAPPPAPPAPATNAGDRDFRGNGFGPSTARGMPNNNAGNRQLRSDPAGRGGAVNRTGNQQRRDWNDGRRVDNSGRGWNGNNRDNRNWDRSWRNDGRYDWQRYRNTNRNAYRLPRYYGPSGWNYGYRRFGVGTTLFSGLFAQNYWINDPFNYRLPPAYWPYQWVRYYDDALLVDTRSGFVVDVIPGIFW